jgi:hypothetical protein
MSWLTLAYFLSLGTLAYQGQMFDPAGSAMFNIPQSYQTTLGVEAQAFDNHLFVGGSVETWESPNGQGFFNPSETFYVFSAGLRGWGFEVGYRHECGHPVVSWTDFQIGQGFLSNKDEFYLSYSGKLKLF